MAIHPFIPRGRRFYSVSFRHPESGKPINRSLGVTEEFAARETALALDKMCADPASWDITGQAVFGYPDAAVKAFHGRLPVRPKPEISLPALVVKSLPHAVDLPVDVVAPNDLLSEALQEVAVQRARVLERDIEIAALRMELQNYRRKYNEHVRATMREAVDAWIAEYRHGRAPSTVDDAEGRVEEFIAFTGPLLKLRDVKSKHIDNWLQTYREERTGERYGRPHVFPPAEPLTLRRRLGCVSVFFSWVVKHYEMSENPIANVKAIAGASRSSEHIEAIRRLDELRALLERLTGYWRAVAAVGCLAGLRLAELIWLKKSDIYLAENYLRVTRRRTVTGKMRGTKTGNERSVRIEQTTLLPILKEYFETNGAGRWRPEWPWAFPSVLDESIYVPRVKTPPGLWSHGSSFNRTLSAQLLKVKPAEAEPLSSADCWIYGAREWRHTAGTAMGLSGVDVLRIAKMLGNSPAVCERHYIGVRGEDAGLRWPFVW